MLIQQVSVAAALDHAALLQNENGVRVPDGRQAMRDDKDRATGHQAVKALFDELFGAGVDGRRRLVQNEDRGLRDGRARNGDELPLALTEVCAVGSNNKAFQPNMGGYSIYASALDGSDPMIRLEGYMQSEKGGKDGWKIERCYMKSDEKEMIDVIFGPFFICDCSGPNYGSLNQEQIDRFMKQFENPERLIRMNGTLMSVPYKPEPDLSR